MTQTTNHGLPLWIYSSGEVRRVVTPKQGIEPVLITRLKDDSDIGSELGLVKLTAKQFQ